MGDRDLRRLRDVIDGVTFRCSTCQGSFQGMTCPRCLPVYDTSVKSRDKIKFVSYLSKNQTLLDAFLKVPNKRVIITNIDGDPYLERIILKTYETGEKDYLHIIYRSDDDRDMHDHPFAFSSKIIHGTYINHMKTGSVVYNPGMTNNMRAEDAHNLEVLDGPVVTYVHRSPKIREWGFHTSDGWVHHQDYLNKKYGNDKWSKGDNDGED